MFSTDIQGRDCGDEASSWLTRYLGAEKTFRLVHFEPQMSPRKPAETEPLFPQNEVNCSRSLFWLNLHREHSWGVSLGVWSLQEVAYPDYGPVMLLSDASVKDLSSRLEKEVTAERFRPNIIVSDCEAFDEVSILSSYCSPGLNLDSGMFASWSNWQNLQLNTNIQNKRH